MTLLRVQNGSQTHTHIEELILNYPITGTPAPEGRVFKNGHASLWKLSKTFGVIY